MKSTGKENNRLSLRSSCVTTFRTLYGIGKVKAQKMNNFLLNHPNQLQFSNDLQMVMNTTLGGNMLAKIALGGKVRNSVYNNLERKINSYCYQAHRLFQNLPTKGQRTRTNGNTSRKRNPYQIVEINPKFFKESSIIYKRLELIHNERFDELKQFEQRLLEVNTDADKKATSKGKKAKKK